MMSIHRIPLTELERAGLINHGLDVGKPSQLSDVFRRGMKWAIDNSAIKWIPVSERLPEYGTNVLIVVDGETEAENQVFEFKIGKWASRGFFESNKDDGGYYYVREVEYWAPLPAAPEQNK